MSAVTAPNEQLLADIARSAMLAIAEPRDDADVLRAFVRACRRAEHEGYMRGNADAMRIILGDVPRANDLEPPFTAAEIAQAGDESNRENGRLIAAAPDLLVALRTVLAQIQSRPEAAIAFPDDDLLPIHTAIAKAEGK